MKQEFYFENPSQVMFIDPDNPGEWLVGIAFRDEIICGCCGGVFEISDVIEVAEDIGVMQAIYSYNEWMNLCDEIQGNELPDGLIYEGGSIIEEPVEEYEQHYFFFEEEEEAQAIAANN